jgi:hypothetical protein
MNLTHDDIIVVSIQENGSAVIIFKDKTYVNVPTEKVEAPQDPFANMRQDIELVAEEMSVELDGATLDALVVRVCDFDYSDYNDYIADQIRELTGTDEDLSHENDGEGYQP